MIKYIQISSALFFFAACVHQTQVKNIETDDRKKVSIGVIFSNEIVHLEKKLNLPAESAVQARVVLPFSSAAKAGLKPNDYVIGYNEIYFLDKKDQFVDQFIQDLKSKKIGDQVKLKILRLVVDSNVHADGKKIKLFEGEQVPTQQIYSPNTQMISAEWKKQFQLIDINLTLEGRNWSFGHTPYIEADFSTSWPLDLNFQKSLEKFIPEKNKDDETDLLNRFQDLAKQKDSLRLGLVSYLQSHPFQIDEYHKQSLQILQSCKKEKSIWPCLKKLVALSGHSVEQPRIRTNTHFNSTHDFLVKIHDVFLKSDQLLTQAFQDLNPEELTRLKRFSKKLINQLENGDFSNSETNSDQQSAFTDNLLNLQKVKMSFLIQSLLVYEEILNSDFLNQLKNTISKESATKLIVEEFKTKEGVFVIGGTQKNNYADYANENVQMIIDLGGDDFYPDISASLIDYSGSDTYEASKDWNLNSGFFKTRILYDLAGDDTYISASGGIATSFCGASLLLDFSGNDKFISQSFSEAVAWTGFSVLVDYSGDDFYQGTLLNQGLGIAGGLGFLFDFSGDDHYFSKGARPSAYGDAGQFSGWSQGVGLGLRNFVSGGWGLLYDAQGKDRFEAGTFSQGGGYYFGIGSLINDGEEDDFYNAGRYGQGFSAHYALGSFLEMGGNDTYYSPSVVGLGLAWDLSLSFFNDRSGNDFYNHPGHFIASASHNSFAFFIDDKGQDHYAGNGLPYEIKANDYHGGQSLGIFWDRGHSVDQYKKLKNNSVVTIPGLQILIDE